MTADTGIDALTHALEAGVSIFASPYTDAFCMQAVNLILDALPRAYRGRLRPRGAHRRWPTPRRSPGSRSPTRSSGVNHALAHAVGARFGIAHGRANAHLPAARAALQRVAADASSCRRPATPPTSRRRSTRRSRWVLGLGGKTEAIAASGCSRASTSCWPRSTMPRSLAELRRGRARSSRPRCPTSPRPRSTDPSMRTNPRMPMIARDRRAAAGGLRQGDLREHRSPLRPTRRRGPPARPRRRRGRAPRRGGPQQPPSRRRT